MSELARITARRAAWAVGKKWPRIAYEVLEQRRCALGSRFMLELDRTVAYGPLQGYRIPDQSWWGGRSRAAQLFGMYEREVLQVIADERGRFRHLIDLGAADGYYAVGLLAVGLAERSICYEMSEVGRALIARSAEENGVAQKIEIRGRADSGFHRDIPSEVASDCLVVVDIEGGEFDVLDRGAFASFSSSVLIVELHDWRFADAKTRMADLLEAASPTHSVSYLTTGPRDLSGFEEWRQVGDNDRWLSCSEGRGVMMTWAVFRPHRV